MAIHEQPTSQSQISPYQFLPFCIEPNCNTQTPNRVAASHTQALAAAQLLLLSMGVPPPYSAQAPLAAS
ncbi:hypothetical protein DAI22_09g068500 [Oryza sativa Japonica Group]|nr:hypothetical protein DAI22_09g068500 [Oryza sativa Japonica Group]